MKIPFLDKLLNRGERVPDKIFQSEPIGAKDIAAPASIQVSQDNIKLGERYVKSFFVFSYPRYLSTGWLSPVINLDSPMDVSMFVHPVDSNEILKKLRKRTAEVQSEIAEREEKGLVRSPELETAYQDLEELRDKLQTAREKMFQFSLYITIYGENKQDLDSTETRLRSILESRMIYPKPALFQQKKGFLSSVPYGTDKLSVTNPMNTAPLSSAFPFISFDLSSNEGILYGVNKHNNSLVLFDRFSLENANSIVFGKSGSGKSIRKQEPVLIKDKEGQVKQTKIGDLIDSLIEEKGKQKIDQETEGVVEPNLKVFTFDKELKGEWKPVKVAARKEAPDTFYKFKTKSGREITTTGDHNLVVLKDGKPTVTQSSEAQAGDFIPLPRKVECNSTPPKTLNLLKVLENSKGVYITGANTLVKNNYQKLKGAELNQKYDSYLYEYKKGRSIPLSYFQKIIDHLDIKPDSEKLKGVKLTSRSGKSKYAIDNKLTIDDLLKLAGYITAEGTIRDDMIIISNGDPKVIKETEQAFEKLGFPCHRRENAVVCMSKVFIEIVKSLHGKTHSKGKRVWPFIFNLNQEQIAAFLSAYFEGDGTVGDNGEVTATSKSKKLISDLSYLLLRFGIVGRIRKKWKKATNSNHEGDFYHQIVISGQEDLNCFKEQIGFIGDKKNNMLKQRGLNRKSNTNVDTIPELSSIFKEIQDLFPPLLHNIPAAHAWKRSIHNPSPEHLRKVVNQIEQKIERFKELEHQYRVLNELPELKSIIEQGKQDKKLNSELWKELGDSWRLMKNKEVQPKSKNAFKAIRTIRGNSYSLSNIKNKIHSGFKEVDLSMKDYNRSLQSALVENPEGNTRYQMIQQSAQYVWENYQDVLQNKIPKVKQKLERLRTLADSELFWDPIVEIEEIENKEDQYVYDLEVDNEVFLAGHGGMFVHNSFFQKLEILRSLMMGTDVIVVDPENEYKFLSDAVGGSYFNMSLTSPHHVNPFDLPPPREDERPEDVLRSNIINLVGLLRIMLGGLDAEEDAIIDRALTETYRARDITPQTDPSLWSERIPLMEDFQSVLETMEGADSLVRRLQKFTQGSYSDFFNQPTNVTMDNNLVCFGIRDMEDELRPMAMFIIMRYIWNTIRANLKKRILVVDEAWWMMKNEDGASFLFGTAKRGRKYWLGVTTITQDVIDFMKSDYGKPIITNSSLQLLMKQSPSGAEAVQDAFNLTEAEKSMLLEAPVGEGLFFAGPKHVGLRVVASYAEEQIITTSPDEVKKIKESKKKLGQQSSKNQSRLEQGEL